MPLSCPPNFSSFRHLFFRFHTFPVRSICPPPSPLFAVTTRRAASLASNFRGGVLIPLRRPSDDLRRSRAALARSLKRQRNRSNPYGSRRGEREARSLPPRMLSAIAKKPGNPPDSETTSRAQSDCTLEKWQKTAAGQCVGCVPLSVPRCKASGRFSTRKVSHTKYGQNAG